MKTIKLQRNLTALVDDEDYVKVALYRWYALIQENKINRVYHTFIREKKKYNTSLHWFVLGYTSRIPGKVIDHINGNTLDNRKSNLRVCTSKENSRNSRLKEKGYKGVDFRKDRKKWRTTIRVEGKKIALGHYESLIEAALAYDKAAKKYFGVFARLNFP